MSTERWLPVVGFEGRYEASDLGRIRSIFWSKPRVLKGVPQTVSGYLVVHLYPAVGPRVQRRVHQIVMEAFAGPRPPGLEIRHLDGVKTNVALSNLQYGTHRENMRDILRHGNNRSASKTHCKHGHEFTPENTGTQGAGNRRCLTCARLKSAARHRRVMAERAS